MPTRALRAPYRNGATIARRRSHWNTGYPAVNSIHEATLHYVSAKAKFKVVPELAAELINRSPKMQGHLGGKRTGPHVLTHFWYVIYTIETVVPPIT